jgi:hypothetical protein
LLIVLNTRYATENDPSTVVVAKSPHGNVDVRATGPFARILETMAADRSIPVTGTPVWAVEARSVRTDAEFERPRPRQFGQDSTTGATVDGSEHLGGRLV